MDKEIRKMLIERARINSPIAYGVIMQQLGLDNSIPEHRKLLSQELAEISRFEHSKKRPMLSSLAMYEGGKSFGPGFYPLAEELNYGFANELKKKRFAYEMQKKCNAFWKDDKNYKKYLNDIIENANIQENEPDFIMQNEISFLAQWAGKVYDKNNKSHVSAKNKIMNSLGSKTVYWSNQLIEQLEGFETFNWRMWSQKGWKDTHNGKQRVAIFKHYTWARIYKIGHEYKDIFFTIGVDGNSKSLVYKLDYYFEQNSELSTSQKSLCEQLIPDEVSWLEIPYNEVPNYTWSKLIEETTNFIKNNETLYDEIVNSVWSGNVNVSKLQNRLIKRDTPENGLDEIPKRDFSFQGSDVDWIQQHNKNSYIGKLGEELVIEYEKEQLINAGKENYANEIRKVKDGEGYDIFSRNLDGSEKKIEVKTTTGNSDTPFPISLTEVAFSEIYASNYSLYRLFNLNETKRVAEFHEFKGNLKNHFLFEEILFNAFRKKKS